MLHRHILELEETMVDRLIHLRVQADQHSRKQPNLPSIMKKNMAHMIKENIRRWVRNMPANKKSKFSKVYFNSFVFLLCIGNIKHWLKRTKKQGKRSKIMKWRGLLNFNNSRKSSRMIRRHTKWEIHWSHCLELPSNKRLQLCRTKTSKSKISFNFPLVWIERHQL